MMKYRFHQFVHIEKGRRNSLIINFINKEIYQVDNGTLAGFLDGDNNSNFVNYLIKERLIMLIDGDRWIPYLDFNYDKAESTNYGMTLELGRPIAKDIIDTLLADLPITKINVYCKCDYRPKKAGVRIQYREYDCHKCFSRQREKPTLSLINETSYLFNKAYNSCWGRKIAINREGKLAPCVYCDFNLGPIEDIRLGDIEDIMGKYWKLNIDNIADCQYCEYRYICNDCRYLAILEKNILNAKSPECKLLP